MAAKRNRKGQFVKGRRKKAAKRRAAPRRRKAATKRRKAPARKKAVRRRRAPARKKAVRRKRRTAEGTVAAMVKTAVPIAVGITVAGMAARAVPAANTPLKRAAVTGAASVGLALLAPQVARSIPYVSARHVTLAGVGMAVDSLWRGTTNIRATAPRLPDAARRPGGLLAGRPNQARVHTLMLTR